MASSRMGWAGAADALVRRALPRTRASGAPLFNIPPGPSSPEKDRSAGAGWRLLGWAGLERRTPSSARLFPGRGRPGLHSLIFRQVLHRQKQIVRLGQDGVFQDGLGWSGGRPRPPGSSPDEGVRGSTPNIPPVL